MICIIYWKDISDKIDFEWFIFKSGLVKLLIFKRKKFFWVCNLKVNIFYKGKKVRLLLDLVIVVFYIRR